MKDIKTLCWGKSGTYCSRSSRTQFIYILYTGASVPLMKQFFPGNCIAPKSQLLSNETVNIHSKWAIIRRKLVELCDLVARRILEMEV